MNDNTPRTNAVEDAAMREHAEGLEIEISTLRQALADVVDPAGMVKRKEMEGINFSSRDMAVLDDVSVGRGIAHKALADHYAKVRKEFLQ